MPAIHLQNQRAGDSWNAAPPRAAGLYGELQPLPLPIAAPLSSAMVRKTRQRSGLID
jgi:hypothetical protein